MDFYCEIRFKDNDTKKEYLLPLFIRAEGWFKMLDVSCFLGRYFLQSPKYTLTGIIDPKIVDSKIKEDYFKLEYNKKKHVGKYAILSFEFFKPVIKPVEYDAEYKGEGNILHHDELFSDKIGDIVEVKSFAARILVHSFKGMLQNDDYLVLELGV